MHQPALAGQNTVKHPLDTKRGRGRSSRTTSTPRSPAASCAPTPAASPAGDIEALALMTASPPTSTPPSARPSPACATSATPGPTSAPGSASPARPPSNAGAPSHSHRRDGRLSPPDRTRARGRGHPPTTPPPRPGPTSRLRTPARRHRRLHRTRSGSAAASTPSTWPPASSPRSTTPPPSPAGCCSPRAATAARPSAPPARQVYKRDARQLVRAGLSGGKGIPETDRRPSVRVRHPHRPLVRPGPRPPDARQDRPALPPPPRRDKPGAARTAATSPARPATPRTIPGSAGRCAPTATTTTPPCCSTPTPATCGAGSPPTCPATWPASPGVTGKPLRAASARSATSRSPSTRHAASSTSTPSSASTPPATTTSRPPPGYHRRAAVRRHRPGRHRRPPSPSPGTGPASPRCGSAARLDTRPIRHGSRARHRPRADPPGRGELHRQVRHQGPRRPRPARPAASAPPPTSSALRCPAHYRRMITTAWRPRRRHLGPADPAAQVGAHARLRRPLPHQIPPLLRHLRPPPRAPAPTPPAAAPPRRRTRPLGPPPRRHRRPGPHHLDLRRNRLHHRHPAPSWRSRPPPWHAARAARPTTVRLDTNRPMKEAMPRMTSHRPAADRRSGRRSWRPANGSPGGSSRSGVSGSSGSAATSASPSPRSRVHRGRARRAGHPPDQAGRPDGQRQGPPTPLRRHPPAALRPMAGPLPGTGRHDRPADRHFATKADAEDWLTRKEAEILERRLARPRRGPHPVRRLRARWIDERPGLRPKTIQLYRYLLRRHLAPDFGDHDRWPTSASRTYAAGARSCSTPGVSRSPSPRPTGCSRPS